MSVVGWIVAWGITAMLASAVAGGLASYKNRDYSSWMAWCFVMPPMLIVLILMPPSTGPAPKRPTLDEEDKHWY